MPKKRIGTMSDRGNVMPEEIGYVLHETKLFARGVGSQLDNKLSHKDARTLAASLEQKADKRETAQALVDLSSQLEEKAKSTELSSLWKSAELAFASKADTNKVLNSLDKYAEKAEVWGALNSLSAEQDHSRLHTTTVEISADDLKALNATPIVLVPAMADKIMEIKRVEFLLDYETTPYTVGADRDLSFRYETAGQFMLVEATGLLDQSSDERRCAHHSDVHVVGVNEAIELTMTNGEITAGNSPLKLRIDYRIVDALI